LPRKEQGRWKVDSHRYHFLERLRAAVAGRRAELLPIRWGRMVASPLAFYRGAAALMAGDLGALPTCGLDVQVCGDAHVLNLGAYAAPDGHLVFDLNDFDEACRGPFEWDLKRLAASVVVAGRVAGRGDRACTNAVHAMVRSYRDAADRLSELPIVELARLEITPRARRGSPLAPVFQQAARNTTEQLLRKFTTRDVGGLARFRNDPPLLRRLGGAEARRVVRSLSRYRDTLGAGRLQVLDGYRPWDVAFKVVGTGSVGVDVFVVLLYGNGPRDPLLLQVKEQDASCWTPTLPGQTVTSGVDDGRRSAEAQLRTQTVTDPFLGWTQIGEKGFVVRQWSDHKGAVKIAELSSETLQDYSALCGEILAKAHVRTGGGAMLAGYCGRGEQLDDAMARFASAYGDQTEVDHRLLRKAIGQKHLEAVEGA